ncbi:MAG: exodeoxyribonuclease VII small subunit [Candidatus Eisenbacteria bacterium]|uniref:Exodeoxyribonuclease 7 small subunit n=1 Tax=Eiseniibacteriota bacterium TaxID=2212470 RepID=A0A849SM54_UNCEI|nr:exodeoxyribonuclease VII small subunit [Candidatus Eisenbacteria bacterium]
MAAKSPRAGKTGAAPDESAGPPFEEALERLETIVDQLEGSELSLEDSLARYEEGIRLSRRLTHTLDAAEKRIERLVEGSDGEPATEPIEDGPRGAADKPSDGELPF